MTEVQKNLLSFIRDFWRLNGYGPSYDEMASGTGQKHKSRVYTLAVQLREQQLIHWDSHRARSIRLTALCCPECGAVFCEDEARGKIAA